MTSNRSLRRSLIAAAAIAALAPSAPAATYEWDIGNLSSAGVPLTLLPADILNIGAGNYKYVDTGLTTQGTVNWIDNLYFVGGNTIGNSGLWNSSTDASLNNSGGGGAFVNSGTFAKTGGTGSTSINGGISFTNSGTIDAETGVIAFNSGLNTFNAGSQFIGAGQVQLNSSAAFNGSFTSQNLQLLGGVYTGTGALINGTVNWAVGRFDGDWTVAAGSTLNLQPGNYKYLNASLTNQGTVNALDILWFQSGAVLTNQGQFNLQGDYSLQNGGGGGSFVNSAGFNKTGGTGTSTIAGGITFVNNANQAIQAQSGVINFASGVVTFEAGTRFTGAGQVQITNNASFNGAFTSQNLQLVSGVYTGAGAVINGPVNWYTGYLAGDWTVAAGTTLSLQPGNYKYLNATLVNKGTMAVADNLYFVNTNALTNQGLYDLQGDFGLQNGGGGGLFVNAGTLTKSSGTGTSTIGGGITFVNNANQAIQAQSGVINFSSGAVTFDAGTQFTGAGQVQITNNASFNGAFTSQNLQLLAGTYTGTAAVINGPVNWTTGYFAGDWTVAAGTTLSLQPGNYKYLNATLANKGTMAAADNLYFVNSNALTNQGLYDLMGDVGLQNGGGGGTFVNDGLFAKSSGTGASAVGGGITFVNNGEIRASTGTIQFVGGANQFNDGTRFTGSGQVGVASNATFVGGFTTQNGNLTLSNGTFTGGDGSAGSRAVANGNLNWATGTLAGNWQVAAGQTLTLQGGNYKYLNAALTNSGTIAATDTLYVENGKTLANQGTYDLRGDVGVLNNGGGGNFVNTGLVVKSAGAGISTIGNGIAFDNAGGTVDVRTGTIRMPDGFTNQGTLKGAGAYAANVLTNAGHVAPGSIGAAPSLLTLDGNYVQTGAGSFDVGLESLGSFGSLLVNGTANLAGALTLDCVGSCIFSAGTELVVLQSTGDLIGTFGSLSASGFGGGAFSVVYTGNEVLLEITQGTVAAVPEPASCAMMFAGLAAIGFVARRRRPR